LSSATDFDLLTADNLFTELDNGVIICQLAKQIEEKCEPFFSQFVQQNQLIAASSSFNLQSAAIHRKHSLTAVQKVRVHFSSSSSSSSSSVVVAWFASIESIIN
jgi:hypothetical protein